MSRIYRLKPTWAGHGVSSSHAFSNALYGYNASYPEWQAGYSSNRYHTTAWEFDTSEVQAAIDRGAKVLAMHFDVQMSKLQSYTSWSLAYKARHQTDGLNGTFTRLKKTQDETYSAYGDYLALVRDGSSYGCSVVQEGTSSTSIDWVNRIPIPVSSTQQYQGVPLYGLTLASYNSSTTSRRYNIYESLDTAELFIETDEVALTLSYDPNGGTDAPAAQTVYAGTVTISNDTPTKTGYSFLGWATTSSASVEQYKAGQSIEVTRDTILYAVWKPDEYAVTYNANGGNDAPAAQIKYHGTSLTLSADTPTKTGYSFRAWNTDQHGSGREYLPSGIYTANETVTLYAQWTANQYKVDCDGVEITVTYGEPYGALPVPHKDGYTFDGWGLEDGTYINASSIVTTASDHRLISAWTPNRYIVEYTDTITTIERPITQDQPWNAEGALFSRTGYSQVEWETDSGYSVPFGSEQRTWGNLVLYAVFSPNEYTITFDSDGGTAFSPRHIYYNSKVGTLPKPTKDKHIFLGWYRHGVKWTAEKVYDLTENVTLTAMWQEESSGYTRAEVYVMTESGAKPASFGEMTADGSARYGEAYVIKES